MIAFVPETLEEWRSLKNSLFVPIPTRKSDDLFIDIYCTVMRNASICSVGAQSKNPFKMKNK